jgi:hypothetical protein
MRMSDNGIMKKRLGEKGPDANLIASKKRRLRS